MKSETSIYIINDLINILVNILRNEDLTCNFKFDKNFLKVYIRDDSGDDDKTIIDVTISHDRMRTEGFDEIVNKIINKINGYLAYKEIEI